MVVGLHILLVTSHGRFAISFEQDKIGLVTLNTTYNVLSF